MIGKKRVKDYMTPFVTACTADTHLSEIARVMTERGIHALPVLEGKKVVGIVSQTDLARLQASQRYRDLWKKAYAHQIMTPKVVGIHPAATLAEAAALMKRHRIHRLVVWEGENGPIRGILSMADINRAVAEEAAAPQVEAEQRGPSPKKPRSLDR